MKKQKENSHEGITWSEMGKQNVQAEKVYFRLFSVVFDLLIDFLQIVGNLDKSKVPLRFSPGMWNEQNTDNVVEVQVSESIKTNSLVAS